MDTLIKLASLTDLEARQCLNRVISGIWVTDPDMPLGSPPDLGGILRGVAEAVGAKPVTGSAETYPCLPLAIPVSPGLSR
ncbi:hypothetical protein B4Q13_25465 [Lacticaseibacillus rhamnosus]